MQSSGREHNNCPLTNECIGGTFACSGHSVALCRHVRLQRSYEGVAFSG